MGHDTHIALFIAIGLVSGLGSGAFGIGGGVLIVPALVLLAGFSQHTATGTSLAVLLPPVGLGAVLEYYRHGAVDLRAGLIIAVSLFLGAWISAHIVARVPDAVMKLSFGVFLSLLGIYLIISAFRNLPV